ncbi:unnamed protein product [Rhizophagus irregularis]|nr:unnamed protein product [Rhizophagus irregularis]
MPKVQRKSFAVRMKQGVKKARRKQIRRLQNTVQDLQTTVQDDDHNNEIVNPDEAGSQVLAEAGTSQVVQDNRAPCSQSPPPPPPPHEEIIRQGRPQSTSGRWYYTCRFMQNYDRKHNGGRNRPWEYCHRTPEQAQRCRQFCHGIMDWQNLNCSCCCYNNNNYQVGQRSRRRY